MLTYGQVKSVLAQYAGKGGLCEDAPEVDLFLLEVFQVLLYSGANTDLRKFTFTAQKGVFTVPFEVEAIVKVKLDNRQVQVQNKWFEFSGSAIDDAGCVEPSNALFEEPNYVCTVYDINPNGSRVAVTGTCAEDEDAHVIVQGKDVTGRPIFSTHKGQQINGEYLSIKRGQKVYSTYEFAEITGITKSPTKGYVQLYEFNKDTGYSRFLSDYSPLEEVPAYKRYRITTSLCSSECVNVTCLARIRLKEKYSDNDRIPFETIHTLRLAAQSVQAASVDDDQRAQNKTAMMGSLIEREASYKKTPSNGGIDICRANSPGRIKNAVRGPFNIFRRYW